MSAHEFCPRQRQPRFVSRHKKQRVAATGESVNADAGKASNLNADKLDGKSEEDFIPSRLYGVSTGVVRGQGGGKTVLVSGVNFSCDDGDVALSAGGNAVGAEDHLNGIVPFRSSYQIEFTDNDGASNSFSANMICADVSKPFR